MMQHIPNTFSKPFQNKYPPIDGNREAVIKYPSDDEDNGTVQISWFIADEIVSFIYYQKNSSIFLEIQRCFM